MSRAWHLNRERAWIVKDPAKRPRSEWVIAAAGERDAINQVHDAHDGAEDDDEPAPTCPTPAKLQEAIEIIEGLMGRKRGGATLVRLHSLVASALDDFFADESDAATPFPDIDNEIVHLTANPPF
jgi:hypothetical protein